MKRSAGHSRWMQPASLGRDWSSFALRVAVAAVMAVGPINPLRAADISRGSAATSHGTGGTGSGAGAGAAVVAPGNVSGVAVQARPNAEARLTAARNAVAAVRAMQAAARSAAQATSAKAYTAGAGWTLQDARGNPVTVTSGLSVNGLNPDTGAVVDDSASTSGNTVTFKLPSTWTGVGTLTQTTTTAQNKDATATDYGYGDSNLYTVDIKQNQQQAVLNWANFSVAPNTKLNFDQSAGGADVGNWIAFNKIGVTGSPSQILGNITAQGQVYVINPNGIIFGGTSQVNTHALVASSLPINDNLIARGLLNNPDSQFLFTAVPIAAGASTAAFTPAISETYTPQKSKFAFTTQDIVPDLTTLTLAYTPAKAQTPVRLVAGTDYTVAQQKDGTVKITFADATVKTLAGAAVTASYTPSVSNYGDITVQPGAVLNSPTSADHVGGKIALIGPNVTNAGTVTSPDGQVILAAGLQVGVTAHASTDPSLRGLDVYVGKVADGGDAYAVKYDAGTATNASTTYADATGKSQPVLGLLETTDLSQKSSDGTPQDRPGNVTVTGKTVQQDGVINSLTTVAFNGRVDLSASYNAVSNDKYVATDFGSQQFNYGTDPTLPSTGLLELGAKSLVQIMPSTSSEDVVAGTQDQGLALHSQVNLSGLAIHLASTAATSTDAASAAVIRAPNADVTLAAGKWSTVGAINTLVPTDGQVYFDKNTLVDVAGSQGVQASVEEFLVNVELRGSELANSPLQRNSALRGQTVVVDSRVHGPWDPTLNNGAGGYTWVGTPLADASGWVGLVKRTAQELTTNGGTVNVQSGSSVVMQAGAKIDVSGGWIDYAGGHIQTTKVISGGHVYDISQATPDRIYTGIFDGSTTTTDSKWGVTSTTKNSTLLGYDDPGYFQGGNGGRVSIATAAVGLDGSFAGNTWSGALQTQVKPTAGNTSHVAIPSQFALKFSGDASQGDNSPTSPDVIFKSGASLASLAPVEDFTYSAGGVGAYALSSLRQSEVDLAPSLVNTNGFGFLSVDTSDDILRSGASKAKVSTSTITVPYDSSGSPVLNFAPASGIVQLASDSGWTQAQLKQWTGVGSTLTGLSFPASNLSLTAPNIEIAGWIIAPGGRVDFSAVNLPPTYSRDLGFTGFVFSSPLAGRGAVNLDKTAAIDLSGSVLDYRLTSTDDAAAQAINGGSLAVSGYQVTAEAGSTIDVSGGAIISAAKKVTWGNGGKISLAANNEGVFEGARLYLPSTYTGESSNFALSGYSGATGGSLSLRAPLIQIDTIQRDKTDPTATPLNALAGDDTLMLDPKLFSDGGFATFRLTGFGESAHVDLPTVLIGSSAVPSKSPTYTAPAALNITPRASAYVADLGQYGSAALQVTPGDLIDVALRTPMSLQFQADRTTLPAPANPLLGEVFVGSNVSLTLAPNTASAVGFKGDEVGILGKITVPGGGISVAGASELYSLSPTEPRTSVYLGPTSVLSTAGDLFVRTQNHGTDTYTVGSVLNGGSISVSGNIVAEKGALLDASGASGDVYYSPFQLTTDASAANLAAGGTLIKQTLQSDGGTITLTGQQSLYSDAKLRAAAGVSSTGTSTAVGGTLTVSSGTFVVAGSTTGANATTPTLTLNNGTIIPVSFASQGITGLGLAVADADGNVVDESGAGFFGGAVSTVGFKTGGFDNLNFAGVVKYSGAVKLSAGSSIAIGSRGVLVADTATPSSLSLSAPYVKLGADFLGPLGEAEKSVGYANTLSPVYGAGTLTVTGARLIDVGNLALLNIGSATLATASGGDLRGDGTLDMAGNLVLNAGQVYPPTATNFAINVYNYTPADGTEQSGSITVLRNGTPTQVPLSAGGNLSLHAASIEQDGVLRAPIGKIVLGDSANASEMVDPISQQAAPTTTKVTVGQGSVTSVSTVDLVTGKSLTEPIPYGINFQGTSWIDPTGTDITLGSASSRIAKSVTISATTISDLSGSSVDITGGGDLLAYRFVSGVNGTKDILSGTSQSFAIIPGYSGGYAPYAPFDSNSVGGKVYFSSDSGYVTNAGSAATGNRADLKIGDSIFLDIDGTGAKSYTLLPARYALLSGAYLVSYKGTIPAGTVTEADGSSVLAAGYRYNSLNASRTVTPIYSTWEVTPSSRINSVQADGSSAKDSRAEYDLSKANAFFAAAALANQTATPRLPQDGGQLVFDSNGALTLKGKVDASPLLKADGTALGRGGIVDISSPLDIVIGGPNTVASDYAGALLLDSDELSKFGAESLLIGGIRSSTTDGTVVSVTAQNVIVDNGPVVNASGVVSKAGTTLSGSDVTLVANGVVQVGYNSSVTADATKTLPAGADKLILTGQTLLSPSEEISVANGGVPLSFPGGSGNYTLSVTAGGSYSTADGTVKTFTASAANPATLTLAAGSTLTFNANEVSVANPATLTVGTNGTDTSKIALVSGDGAALRVSVDPSAKLVRNAVALLQGQPKTIGQDTFSSPGTVLMPGSTVSSSKGSVVVDSTYVTELAFDATGIGPHVSANSVTFTSRRIATVLGNVALSASDVPNTLILQGGFAGSLLSDLTNGTTTAAATQNLTLQSYTSIDTFGSGTIGGSGLQNLTLGTAQILNRDGGSPTFAAKNIQIDNALAGSFSATGSTAPKGTLSIVAQDSAGTSGTLQIGSKDVDGVVRLDQFASVNLTAGAGVLLAGTGGLDASGSDTASLANTNLSIATPLVTALAGADQAITAGGKLALQAPSTAPATVVTGGLGATVDFEAQKGISADTQVKLPSGSLVLHTATGDIAVGGTLDVSGQAKTFNDVVQYAGGGQITATADAGSVTVGSTAILDVSAALRPSALDSSGAISSTDYLNPANHLGNAGYLTINAAQGGFANTGLLRGVGGFVTSADVGYTAGRAGTFALDVGQIPDLGTKDAPLRSLSPINGALDAGGFTQERDLRVRTGDVVVDGSAAAHIFKLGADQGTITVSGSIDASGSLGGRVNQSGLPSDFFGNHGGTIELDAHGSVVLEKGATLSVKADDYDAAGKGGAIVLSAGASSNGVAPAQQVTRDAQGNLVYSGTVGKGGTVPSIALVDIQTGSSLDLSVGSTQFTAAKGAVYTLPIGTPGGDLLVSTKDGTIKLADGSTAALVAGTPTAIAAGSTITLTDAGSLAFAGSGTGGSIQITDTEGHSVRLMPDSATAAASVVSAATAADQKSGLYTGTLHLRAPQSATMLVDDGGGHKVASTPDVQINPINGGITGAASIVLEGYKTYTPVGGYIDTVETQVDDDARAFASSANTTSILGALTKNNAALAKQTGLLHLQPGAEIVGANSSYISFRDPGNASTVAVPANASITIPNTTGAATGVTTNTVSFNVPVTLVPVDAGAYTAAQTFGGSGTPTLSIQPSTTLTATADIPANTLVSTLAGSITYVDPATGKTKTAATFKANAALPEVLPGYTVNFTGSGAGTLTASASVTANVTTTFVAGQTVTLPAGSSVALTTSGGKVTFTQAGLIAWSKNSKNLENAFAVQASSNLATKTGVISGSGVYVFSDPGTSSTVAVPAKGKLTITSTTSGSATRNTLFFNSAVSITTVDAGSYVYTQALSPSGSSSVSVKGSSTLVTLDANVPAGTLNPSIAGTIKDSTGAVIGSFTAGATISTDLAAGDVISFSGTSTGTLTASAATAVDISNPIVAKKATTLPANSTVLLSTNGGSVTFTNAGTVAWQKNSSDAKNAFAVQVAPDNTSVTTNVAVNSSSNGTGGSFKLASAGVSYVDASGGTSLAFPGGLSGSSILITDLSGGGSAQDITLKVTLGASVSLTAGGTVTPNRVTGYTVATTLTATPLTVSSTGTVVVQNGTSGDQVITSSADGVVTLSKATLAPGDEIAIAGSGGNIKVLADLPAGALSVTDKAGETSVLHPTDVVKAGTILKFNGGDTVTVGSLGNGVNSIGATITDTLASGVGIGVPAGSTIALSKTGTLATNSGRLAVSVGDTFAATDLTHGKMFLAGDVVTVTGGTGTIDVKSTGTVGLTGAGAITVNATNQSRIGLTAGSGVVVAVDNTAQVETNGATAAAPATADLILASSWDLSNYRYGPNADPTKPGSGEPGVLTLRSPGNLIFAANNTAYGNASLSDGFGPAPTNANGGLWQASLLPAGSRSWSYRLVAGADLTSANPMAVQPLGSLDALSGSVLIGQGSSQLPSSYKSSTSITRTAIIPLYYQTIRTGTGDIDVAAGRDLQLLNPLATIYTAGTQVANASSLVTSNDFDVPLPAYRSTVRVGSIQEFSPSGSTYVVTPAQYSYGGGNVNIFAQQTIAHYDPVSGADDSSKEMPTNWLYRRSYIDSTGSFGTVYTQNFGTGASAGEVASTTWWVDFTNFFEGVGALGGGNVSLVAGRDIRNVDALVPTNARVTKTTASGDTTAAKQTMVELGGGNLAVVAGNDLNAGVYYVEKGSGHLDAGRSIASNATRATGLTGNNTSVTDPLTWLPTTLFAGKASFDISAGSDVTIGAMTNPFLLPQGINNSYFYRTFFSTMSASDELRVNSLQGNITFKEAGGEVGDDGNLWAWYSKVQQNLGQTSAFLAQPWLRLIENTTGGSSELNPSFKTPANLLPSNVEAIAFSGDIDLVNNVTLVPSASGSLNLIASGAINGLRPKSVNQGSLPASANNPYIWQPATVDLSDADPRSTPGIFSADGFFTDPTSTSQDPNRGLDQILNTFDALFAESGATSGSSVVLQTQQTLHGVRPDDTPDAASHALHAADTQPARLYAGTGDISGLTLFTGKAARVIAGQDITDVALYIQNANANSVSLVSAGRDIIPYDLNSTLRIQALATGLQTSIPAAQAGDIQISGPGAMEVIAGRNIELGAVDTTVNDGTAVGISSIGNTRNPRLPFAGADLFVGAGIGDSFALHSASLNFVDPANSTGFVDNFLNPNKTGSLAAEHLPELAVLMGIAYDAKKEAESEQTVWTAFTALDDEHQRLLALQMFYAVLKDAGRNHNDPKNPGFGNFDEGYAALATLFNGRTDFSALLAKYLTTSDPVLANRYVPALGKLMGAKSDATNQSILAAFNALPSSQQKKLSAELFSLALGDAASGTLGSTKPADVVDLVFPADVAKDKSLWSGNISMSSRQIVTTNGGSISAFAPGGGISLGHDLPAGGSQAVPGIITQRGGNINILAKQNVDVGASRIFTLRGGNITAWSTAGNIAAGVSAKTVQAAPPTRVLIDPQSADVKTDLAGLATGGGIGVLATVVGVPLGDVDLIAPVGTVDAGDAGIQASGNLNIAALHVVNAANISAGGSASGVPPPPPAPNVAGLTSANSASNSTGSAANEVAKSQTQTPTQLAELPSLITVEVVGYGGGEGDDTSNSSGDSENAKKKDETQP